MAACFTGWFIRKSRSENEVWTLLLVVVLVLVLGFFRDFEDEDEEENDDDLMITPFSNNL
jgi:hypothetical protein